MQRAVPRVDPVALVRSLERILGRGHAREGIGPVAIEAEYLEAIAARAQ